MAFATMLLAGCFAPQFVAQVPPDDCPPPEVDRTPRKLVIFFDGTRNDQRSHTNVSKLHDLVTSQSRCDINTLYVEGVGTGVKVLGAQTGWGIGWRVRLAYGWLAANYDETRNDSVFVFGFSRGAYSARILAAMVHSAGVPDVTGVSERATEDGVRRIYHAYKGKQDSLSKRQSRATAAMEKNGWPQRSAEIAFMGLFDTVEALGFFGTLKYRFSPTGQYVEDTNRNYGDQLCNVKKAAHAMSLDDNRAFIFTPKLLTRPYLVAQCLPKDTVDITTVVNEVWFAGAHADVGGRADSELDGVPLNWMLQELAPYGLLRTDAVPADSLAPAINPLGSKLNRRLYGYRKREIYKYIDSTRTQYAGARLQVHASALWRLEPGRVKQQWWESRWYEHDEFLRCFEPKVSASDTDGRVVPDTNYIFKGGADCRVKVVR